MDAMERTLKLEAACCDAGHNPCDEAQQRGWPTVCNDCVAAAIRSAEAGARLAALTEAYRLADQCICEVEACGHPSCITAEDISNRLRRLASQGTP